MGSHGSRMRQASLDISMTSMDGADGVAGASMDIRGGSVQDGVEDIEDHFMQPLTAVDFMQVRSAIFLALNAFETINKLIFIW